MKTKLIGRRSGWQKGQSGNPAGKLPGTQNYTTKALKDAFLGAFKQIGGEDAIVKWMNEKITYVDKKGRKVTKDMSGERKEAFFKIISQMFPREVSISDTEVNKPEAQFSLERLAKLKLATKN